MIWCCRIYLASPKRLAAAGTASTMLCSFCRLDRRHSEGPKFVGRSEISGIERNSSKAGAGDPGWPAPCNSKRSRGRFRKSRKWIHVSAPAIGAELMNKSRVRLDGEACTDIQHIMLDDGQPRIPWHRHSASKCLSLKRMTRKQPSAIIRRTKMCGQHDHAVVTPKIIFCATRDHSQKEELSKVLEQPSDQQQV